jgi:hypothetical protein
VLAAAVMNQRRWRDHRILNPLSADIFEDEDPAAVSTWIMPAMQMALLYLHHRKHEHHLRSFVSLLGIATHMDFPVRTPDATYNRLLTDRATKAFNASRPAFTRFSGVHRPNWSLWRNRGYFAASDFKGDNNAAMRTTALTSLGMRECPMESRVNDGPALFEEFKHIVQPYVKSACRTREGADHGRDVVANKSGRSRRVWHFEQADAMTPEHFMLLVEEYGGSYDTASKNWLLEVFNHVRTCNGLQDGPQTPPPPPPPPVQDSDADSDFAPGPPLKKARKRRRVTRSVMKPKSRRLEDSDPETTTTAPARQATPPPTTAPARQRTPSPPPTPPTTAPARQRTPSPPPPTRPETPLDADGYKTIIIDGTSVSVTGIY